MTPPIFNLGDEVEVIGTDRYGNDTDKTKFTIVMMWADDGKTFYSDRYKPWYPASSLQLVPKFKKGDPVEVVHASDYDSRGLVGEKFTIDDIEGDRVTATGYPWIRTDCLRLVEERKIGDWVEVIGPNTTDPSDDSELGDVFQISEIRDTSLGRKYSADDHYRYLASSLRKLTPEEIADHMQPKDETIIRMASTIERCCERLSAIEKRLTFVEKFQRDQDDLIGRAIRDGVVEIWRKT